MATGTTISHYRIIPRLGAHRDGRSLPQRVIALRVEGRLGMIQGEERLPEPQIMCSRR
jgi:hypothetical protein